MSTLEQLTGMGFSEDAAKAALEAHGSTGGALDALLGLVPHDSPQAKFNSLVDAAQSSAIRDLHFFFLFFLFLDAPVKVMDGDVRRDRYIPGTYVTYDIFYIAKYCCTSKHISTGSI